MYLLTVFLQDSQERSGENDRPVGGFGFGLGEDQFALSSVDLTFYTQCPGLEIEVIPLESQKLASTQAGGDLQQEQLIAATFTTRNLAPNDIKQVVDEIGKISHKAFGEEKT